MAITDSEEAYRIPKEILIITGMWPNDNPNISYRIRTLISWLSAWGIFSILVIELMYAITDFTQVAGVLYIWMSYVSFIVKMIIFSYRKKEILSLLEYLKNPSFVTYPEELDYCMVKAIKTSIFVSKVYLMTIVGLSLGYLIYPIMDHKPLPFDLPYDLGKYTIVMYILQIIGQSFSEANDIDLDLMITSLMAVVIGQLDILTQKIIRLNYVDTEGSQEANKPDENIYEKLQDCVRHHVAIIRTVNDIEDLFTVALFSQFLSSVMAICNTIFHFVVIPLSAEMLMLIDYLICMIIQIFIYCWYGNEIIIKSSEVGDACYMSKWYMSNKKASKYLFIMMERSKRPLKITTMKISVLSLAAFTAILRWSYSYLTLLLKMHNKESPQSAE